MATNQRSLADWALAVLALCAVVVSGLVVKREFFPRVRVREPVPLEAGTGVSDSTWAELIRTGHWIGPKNASVVLVEFADFECPFCSGTAAAIRDLAAVRPKSVALVFHHFPLLSIHPEALAAAVASECAAEVDRFGPYHDYLFANQDRLGVRLYLEAASGVGIQDVGAFEECLGRPGSRESVAKHQRRAEMLQLASTPTLWGNGRLLNRVPDSVWVDKMSSHR